MREMTKILLSACTLCAVGQAHTARAQRTPAPGPTPSTQPSPAPPPIPSDSPSSPSPSDPSSSSPATPDDQAAGAPTPTSPAIPQGDPPSAPVPGPPDATSSTTTTTTTTSTSVGGAADSAAAPVTIAPDTGAGGPDTGSETDVYGYGWHEPGLQSGIGVSVLAGGGVTQFTNQTMRNTTSNLGGLWDLHVTLGSHLPLALDLAYVGSATHIAGLPSGNTGTLVGTAAEGTLRWNVLPHLAWTPYVFGGVGWQRYDVTQTSVSLSDSGMNSSDNLLEVPAGLGFAFRAANGLVADVHGTYRWTWDQDLVLKSGAPTLAPTSSDFLSMHTWEASAALGYEF